VPPRFASAGDRPVADLVTGEPLTTELPGGGHYPPGDSGIDPPPAGPDRAPDPGQPGGPDADHYHRDPDYRPVAGAGPTEPDRGGETSTYQGRRRAGRPVAAWSRRAAGAALAVGVGLLLVATGLLVQALQSGPAPLPAPPTPLPQLAPSPEAGPDRLGAAPNGSPAPASATPTGDPGPSLTGSAEAEAAEIGSHAQVTSLAGASGGQAVRLSGNRDGTFVEFTGVTVPAAGRYQLTVFYAAEQRRTGTVTVNGEPAGSVTLPAVDGIGSVSVSVELAAGNTVRIGTAGGAPVWLDRITVSG
jgi:hypothetical protein